MAGHALLSPSSAKQWINCPPSARLQEFVANVSGTAADEGTLAHYLAETILTYELERLDPKTYKSRLNEIMNNKLYHPEMMGYCLDYVNTILANVSEKSHVLVEKKVTFTPWVREGSGTADGIVITGDFLDFYDLKYGKGVEVSAQENEQLKCYALGILNDYGHIFNIKRVRLNIYQPRIDNFDSFSISVSDLFLWAETVLKKQAALAWKGEGDLKVGDHCKFCRVKATCTAMAEFTAEALSKDFSDPKILTDAEVLQTYGKIKIITDWASSVSDYVLKQALRGKSWPGYKLVEGKSNRAFINPLSTEKLLLKKGYENIYTPQKLLGVTALHSEIGANAFKQLVEPGLTKPKGAPTLVPASDKRKVYNCAKSDFEGLETEENEFLS